MRTSGGEDERGVARIARRAVPAVAVLGALLACSAPPAGADGCVLARYYLNVFPALAVSRPLGSAVSGPAKLPSDGCPVLSAGNVPELEPGAAAAAGLPVARSAR